MFTLKMQPSARMIIFEFLRKGDSFAKPCRKTFSSASVSYAKKMHRYQLQRIAKGEEISAPPRPKKYLTKKEMLKGASTYDCVILFGQMHGALHRSHGYVPLRFKIVGLGNLDLPSTRHSVGMQVLDRLANCLHTNFSTKKSCSGCIATASLDDLDLVLLKPTVPMNVNGTSVKQTVSYYKISPKNVYLVQDELESRLGKLTIKEKGSASGHNGVRSVMDSLHTDNVPRVKIGIDKPDSKSEISKHVLGKFDHEEQKVIEEAILGSIVKLVEHLGERTGADTSSILQEIDRMRQRHKMRSH